MDRSGVEPCIFVVMGATGDLAHRKLLPALYSLISQNLLPDNFAVLGVARSSAHTDESFRQEARNTIKRMGLPNDEKTFQWLQRHLYYQAIGEEKPSDFHALAARIAAIEQENQLPGNRAFYLAMPPISFPRSITGLGEAGLNQANGWTRLVVEKPFGSDLHSAIELNALIHRYFDESQIYRIDHYLGKETVQNLFVFRFANPIFETLWNRDRVENVQITVAETVGVEGRAGYYETSGVVRDMVQNHLTQLLAVLAMEIPGAFRADAILNEKIKVLDSIAPIETDDAVLGQYIEGLIDGGAVPGYLEEPNVNPASQVPTFAALRLKIENWRWHGVPFYLRTGKRLRKKMTELVITFRCPPVMLFKPHDCCEIRPNVLVITIQPDEGFDLSFEVKVPGQGITLQRQALRFRYGEVFPKLPEAYETLLLDFLLGDQALFVRSDLVESSWRLYEPLLEGVIPVHPYASGTWGPAAAEQLLARDGAQWFSQ